MIVASLIVLLACAVALAHVMACAARRRERDRPPIADLGTIALPFALALVGAYVARGLARGSWGLTGSMSTVFVICAVIAWAAWAAGRWLPVIFERPRVHPQLFAGTTALVGAALVGALVAEW